MARHRDTPHVTYLPSGVRIVGAGAERFVEQVATATAERLTPGDPADTAFAVQFTTDPVVKGRPTVETILEAITEEVRQSDEDCPRLVRDDELVRPVSRFSGLRYAIEGAPGHEWVGELVWRSVHPVVAGAPLTTHVLIEGRPSFTRVTARVLADHGLPSIRGFVGAGQVQPAFLRALRPQLSLTWSGAPFGPRVIGNGGIVDFVQNTLGDPKRDLPVAVLTPLEDGEFLVEPDDLAWDLLGRARLYVINDHRQTFELSDAVGDSRMSCYWGAVRCYMPGWSRHDDPYDHPLLVGERVADPVLRVTWVGEVGLWLAARVQMPTSILKSPEVPEQADGEPEPDVAQGDALERASVDLDERPEQQDTNAAPPAASAPIAIPSEFAESPSENVPRAWPAPPDTTPLIEALIRKVSDLASAVAHLGDEVERLRTISAVRASSTNAIERRLGRLEDILAQAFPDGTSSVMMAEATAHEAAEARGTEPAEEGAPTLLEVVHDSAESHADALVFLDSALTSAGDSPYEDPERVRAILEAMARVARRRRDGVLGTSLREAFSDLGIDYRVAIARSTPARLREQYRFTRDNGELVEAEEHVVLGNTYDPRRCLRIYFSSRVPNEPRFVIGHVGRHFQVQSST
jgi:hypothetical protein